MNLISKKDLLAITGISYGQLYRWKRERLIPEEWFIKQSAYTGQETFFPREQILSRVKSILELKDKYSLEELAKILSPETSLTKITIKDLYEIEEINKGLLELLPKIYKNDYYDFIDVVFIVAVSESTTKAGLTNQQCAELIGYSIPVVSKQKSTNITCTVFSVGEEYHMVISPSSLSLDFDGGIQIIDRLSLSEVADKIKIKYDNKFI
ncbi:DUF4004 family protein [Mobilitalea sibirica]|uniref:DUF4004 family protein n=1 Tax=Mobilitalea sibirica TaxID=1462919 RepID=UPI001FB05D4F|nr:DUF4004 family protein [Mobilitalea sibirica]